MQFCGFSSQLADQLQPGWNHQKGRQRSAFSCLLCLLQFFKLRLSSYLPAGKKEENKDKISNLATQLLVPLKNEHGLTRLNYFSFTSVLAGRITPSVWPCRKSQWAGLCFSLVIRLFQSIVRFHNFFFFFSKEIPWKV